MKLHFPSVRLLLHLSGALFFAVGATFLLSGCDRDRSIASGVSSKNEKTLYTCGMHPQVVQDHPGNCPICGMKRTAIRKQNVERGGQSEGKIKYYKSSMTPGETSQTPRKDSMGMDMVPVYEEETAVAADARTIPLDPVTIQKMGIRTAIVTRGPLRRNIRTVGAIENNETTLADVNTKFKGWIEKLYVNSTGELVMRGDPLFEIYSPDLYSAQREYLLALQQGTNATGADSLKTSALNKLRFFDISDEQIAELERTRQPRKAMRILAPQDGFVVEKMAVQGQMVDSGMKLYRLADLGLVWVQAQIYEQDIAYLKLGQEAIVTLSYLPDREFRGRVTYIYPNVDEKTRTARVRMEFHNPGYFLKPGMFATVQVSAQLAPEALLVPDMAVLRSGERNTVFVALQEGKFEARTVTLGAQGENDFYQVLSGLNEGERVVTSGQFMLDSESQLREAIQKMQEPVEHGGSHSQSVTATPAVRAADSPRSTAADTSVKYICPMPEHVSIEYLNHGNCPICGMTLVPVTAAALAKLQPGGKLLYYTCPMPEHADVRGEKPGKCPKCGMTEIPVMAPPPGESELEGRRTHEIVQLPSALNLSDASSATNPASTIHLYTCPMASHADVVSDKGGKCTKCDMKLVDTRSVKHGKIAEEKWRKQHEKPQ